MPRDERKLGNGELQALGFDTEPPRCQGVTHRPRMMEPGPLKLECGALKACGHSHLPASESLGEGPGSEPGNPHQAPWTNLSGARSRAGSDPSRSAPTIFSAITGRACPPALGSWGAGTGAFCAFHREGESGSKS